MVVAKNCPVLPIGAVARACRRPTWAIRRLLDRGVRGVRIIKLGPARLIMRSDLAKVRAAVPAAGKKNDGRRGAVR